MAAMDVKDFGLRFTRAEGDADVQAGMLPPILPFQVMVELPTSFDIAALSHLLNIPAPIIAARLLQMGFEDWMCQARAARPGEPLLDDYRAALMSGGDHDQRA